MSDIDFYAKTKALTKGRARDERRLYLQVFNTATQIQHGMATARCQSNGSMYVDPIGVKSCTYSIAV